MKHLIEVFVARLPLREQHLSVIASMAPLNRSCYDRLRRYRRAKRCAQRWRLRVTDSKMGWHCAVTSSMFGPTPSMTTVRDWLAGDTQPNINAFITAWLNISVSAGCTGHEPTLAVVELWKKLGFTNRRAWSLVRRLQDRVAVSFYVIATS